MQPMVSQQTALGSQTGGPLGALPQAQYHQEREPTSTLWLGHVRADKEQFAMVALLLKMKLEWLDSLAQHHQEDRPGRAGAQVSVCPCMHFGGVHRGGVPRPPPERHRRPLLIGLTPLVTKLGRLDLGTGFLAAASCTALAAFCRASLACVGHALGHWMRVCKSKVDKCWICN